VSVDKTQPFGAPQNLLYERVQLPTVGALVIAIFDEGGGGRLKAQCMVAFINWPCESNDLMFVIHNVVLLKLKNIFSL
jgi:hypothetical protein